MEVNKIELKNDEIDMIVTCVEIIASNSWDVWTDESKRTCHRILNKLKPLEGKG